ncbi:uncharacterized protein ARMOST_10193 [Armillaria ostoyae]|uniref:Uncharacterized protein n=1 Tax=Armillaria ostoyae TaxID=47428 RepID=A0A284RDL3_ARMOS|nr:uncharacterized protein ARMOST_10193 [Armillaria ostoyae]
MTPTPAARSKYNPTPSINSYEADDSHGLHLCWMVEVQLLHATGDLLSLHKHVQHHPDDHDVTLSWIDKNINDCANTLNGLQDLRRRHFQSYNTSAPHLQTLPISDTDRALAAAAWDRTRPKRPVVNAGTQTPTPCPLTPNLSYAEKARPPSLSHNELPPPAPCPPPEKHYPKARTVAPSNFDPPPIPQTNGKKHTTGSAPSSKPRPSSTPLASQRLILQFVNRSIVKTLPDPQGLRDHINIALEGTNRLQGVNLTRGGNIVLHTLAPFTALNLTDADKPRFTLDRPWHRIVVHNVPIVDATTRVPVHEELL